MNNTEPAFTPGPWAIKWGTNVFAGERLVANAGGHSSNVPGDDHTAINEANAHLIAAAPLLYEALQHFLTAIPDPDGDAAWLAITALRAARGEVQG